MDTKTLIQVTAPNTICAIASAFGELQRQGREPKSYLTDLLHDGGWIERHCSKRSDSIPFVFYWGTRECGTSIGTDLGNVQYANTTLFKVSIACDALNDHITTIQEMD